MAVTKTLTEAVPYEKDGKIVKWNLEMKYEDGDASADPSTYYSSTYSISVNTTEETPKGLLHILLLKQKESGQNQT